MEEKTKDLNLLLLYLTGWEEDSQNKPGEKVFRSWKGYLFEILNELSKENLIRQFPKSVILTEEGLKKAVLIQQKYF